MRKMRALALAAALVLTLTAAACPPSDENRDGPGEPVCVDVEGDREDCPRNWGENLDWQ